MPRPIIYDDEAIEALTDLADRNPDLSEIIDYLGRRILDLPGVGLRVDREEDERHTYDLAFVRPRSPNSRRKAFADFTSPTFRGTWMPTDVGVLRVGVCVSRTVPIQDPHRLLQPRGFTRTGAGLWHDVRRGHTQAGTARAQLDEVCEVIERGLPCVRLRRRPRPSPPRWRDEMNPNRAKELWDYLSDDGFHTTSVNRDWFKSVVVSMLLSPGTDKAIKERAREVVQALGLKGITFPKHELHPSFHLGCPGPRKHFKDKPGGYMVGLNHSFDDLGVYCATHDRPWNEHEACTPSCRYGMRRPPKVNKETA